MTDVTENSAKPAMTPMNIRWLSRTALIVLIGTSAVIPMGCDCQTGAPEATVAAVDTDGSVARVALHYEIEGMHCNGCSNAIAAKVSELEGVKECTVDLESKSAVIQVANAELDAPIREAVERLGYTIRKTQ